MSGDAVKACTHCGVSFSGPNAKRYCSTQCQVRAGSKVNEAGCWIWQKGMSSDGYGRAWMPSQKMTKPAMRLAYEAFKGPVPSGASVCHTCDVRACVNPEHLWLGDAAANNRDMVNKRRHGYGEASGRAKLSEKDVRAIRTDSRGCDLLAREYGVASSCIVKIRARTNWKHVI